MLSHASLFILSLLNKKPMYLHKFKKKPETQKLHLQLDFWITENTFQEKKIKTHL